MINRKIDAVILAGGQGTRIRKLAKYTPKPLVVINNKIKFLDYLINNISKYDFNNIFILAGYKGDQIYKRYNNKKVNLVNIKVVIEKKPLGTGGCLNLIKKKVSSKFILFNGDTIFDINLNEFIKNKFSPDEIYMALLKSKKKENKNNPLSKLNLKKKVIYLDNKLNFKNGGIYILYKKIIEKIPEKFTSLEQDIILKKITQNKVKGKLYKNFFLDIGTPKDFKNSKKIIPKYFLKPALFLDRDGTINIDKGYTYKFNNFEFYSKTLNFLKKITKKNYYIFIITNQAGIAKGKFTIEDFYKLHIRLKSFFIRKNIFVNEVAFCPYHPNAKIKKYKKKSNYRKPGNLMIENIKKRWNIDLKKSLMIGDKKSDQLAATKSSIKFNYFNKDLFKSFKKN